MKVRVVLVVCLYILLQETHGAAIQVKPGNGQDAAVISTTPILESIDEEITSLDFYDPKVDAEAIHNALVVASPVDTKTVVEVLAGRAGAKRMKMAEEYKILYKIDLAEDLNQALDGWFKELMVSTVTPLTDYYAKELYEAMEGTGTDEDTLIDILCTSTSQQIREVREVYENTYKETLKLHVEVETSGYFEDLLVALIDANRDESENVDKTQAIADAKALYLAGEGVFGTDEPTFIKILTQRNYKQLKQIFDEYENMTGNSLESAIQTEFSMLIEKGLLAICKTVRNLPSYFADRLHSSMAGTGTNNKHLIRIIAARSEIDLFLVRIYYNLNYEITLEEDIIDDTSGDYRRGLLRLVEGN